MASSANCTGRRRPLSNIEASCPSAALFRTQHYLAHTHYKSLLPREDGYSEELYSALLVGFLNEYNNRRHPCQLELTRDGEHTTLRFECHTHLRAVTLPTVVSNTQTTTVVPSLV